MAAAHLAEHAGPALAFKSQLGPPLADNVADADGMVKAHLFPRLRRLVVRLGAGHCQIVVVASHNQKEEFFAGHRRQKRAGKHHSGDFLDRLRVALGMIGPAGEGRKGVIQQAGRLADEPRGLIRKAGVARS